MASKLKQYPLKSFIKGYNSYAQSKSMVDDEEIPYGTNTYLDDNGSATKRSGRVKFGGELASGKAVNGMGILRNDTYNNVIAAAGTAWYKVTSSTSTPLTGFTFTTDLPTDYQQAYDRLYGANGTDNLCYTDDTETVTEVSSNGNIGRWPVYYNKRLYMTNSTYKDRVYYSNSYTSTESSLEIGNFGTFDTDLDATPPKNAGFLVLSPGSGVEITGLFADTTQGDDIIYIFTKNHGIWKLAYASDNSDKSIAHSLQQAVVANSSPSGRSIGKVANDVWFFGRDNFYTYGEVAQFQNVRVSPKSGRVKSEVNSIANSGVDNVAFGFFQDRVWFAYQTGTFNDHCLVYDVRLNAWSTPLDNINVSSFLEFTETDGTRRFLGASSDPDDSYIYQLESGLNDDGSAVSATFETKSTDCGHPGLIKRFAFIDVFYSMLYGTLDYEVFIDETLSAIGTLSLGNSSSLPVGIGSQMIGSFDVGDEFNSDTTFASLQQNSNFRIPIGFTKGKKISLRCTNDKVDEQFKINGLVIHYLPGSVYET